MNVVTVFKGGLALMAVVVAIKMIYDHGQDLRPAAPQARPIVFDNGTVRTYTTKAMDPQESKALLPGLKKCVKGTESTYTNFACPPGFKLDELKSDQFNVVQDEGAKAARSRAAHLQSVQEAHKRAQDDDLHARIIERAVNPSGGK